jgi:hypothetical protein
MMKKIYISGPMTGLPQYNRPAFNLAAVSIRKSGSIPINPARHPLGLDYEEYMSYSMLDVEHCDCVALLPGWETSLGALREVAYAAKLEKPVYEMSEVIS